MSDLSFKLSERTVSVLRCPACHGELQRDDGAFLCRAQSCGLAFPVVDGVPILINEANSVFAIDDYRSGRDTTFSSSESTLRRWLYAVMPELGVNLKAERNYARFAELLLERAERPLVFIVGGGFAGKGADKLLADERIELIESDVTVAERTGLICDGHDLPLDDSSVDGIVIQAVLEHVLDPVRCVAEIHRVLKPGGVVYAEVPFIQQVHGGAFDFTRFTDRGFRRLFRGFDEIAGGACGGPGMALAWSIQYFLLSFSDNLAYRRLVNIATCFGLFWLKWFDRWLIDRPAALDAASGVYFLGSKRETPVSDSEIIAGYRGRQRI